MIDKKSRIHDQKSGAAITVRVNPRAGKNKIIGILEDGTVKISLAAAPIDGEANGELISFLAEVLEIRQNQLEIVSGKTGRNKLIAIIGLDSQTVEERILANQKK